MLQPRMPMLTLVQYFCSRHADVQLCGGWTFGAKHCPPASQLELRVLADIMLLLLRGCRFSGGCP
jgi:hypothetical protein